MLPFIIPKIIDMPTCFIKDKTKIVMTILKLKEILHQIFKYIMLLMRDLSAIMETISRH
jgi:hypothetical protein